MQFPVDICAPEWDRQQRKELDDFPVVFRNEDLTQDDLSPLMKKYSDTMNLLTGNKKRRCLISSHYGQKVLLTTELL